MNSCVGHLSQERVFDYVIASVSFAKPVGLPRQLPVRIRSSSQIVGFVRFDSTRTNGPGTPSWPSYATARWQLRRPKPNGGSGLGAGT